MATPRIDTLFACDIRRRIEEVIKVDQTDEQVLRDEISEYVVTDAIRKHYTEVFDRYAATPGNRHEGIAVWVSGFFGSGKSSFAKILGLALSDRPLGGARAGKEFGERAGDTKIKVLLATIAEKIPTHAVIFDVSTDRGIRTGNQTLTEIMYGLFLQSLGYARDLDLSELEIALEEKNALARFESEYARIYEKSWSDGKKTVAFALSEASHVLHQLDPKTYPMADSWVKAVKGKADITPGRLAERATQLMDRRKPGQSLVFVIDEVGQFVARDVQKMLDLQAVVQSLGVKGKGRHWIVVTSQEKLGEVVSGLDDNKIELSRLMDRFPLQVHLEPSDISEVTSRRVLSKNAAAQQALGKLFDEHRGRLTACTRVTGEYRLPEVTRDSFVDLYPLLPYQVDLIIQVVSGLRTQGGAGRHVGGANRTIIKLAQQLLINPGVDLAGQPVGVLAQLDQVYDLVSGNIGSEIRGRIDAIPQQVDHPLAQNVAKTICLLQFAQSYHRTAENIAACLHPAVDADSRLAPVKEALLALEKAHLVRQGDGGYRIPTPAEDDWERNRNSLRPRPGEVHRIHADLLGGFWQPAPSFTYLETKSFRAGLAIHGRVDPDGDVVFHLQMAEAGKAYDDLSAELRKRSQEEPRSVFWAVPLNEAIDRETVELYRSKEMVERRARAASTKDQEALSKDESDRLKRHQAELRRLLRLACLSGNIYFRGNERVPRDGSDVGKAAAEILGTALPELFNRFGEAAARTVDLKRALDALLAAENLQGLPGTFHALKLLRDEAGKTVFHLDDGPLAEVYRRIEERQQYGETTGGKWLETELGKEPFGWDFEAVRLFVLCLLRAGRIEMTSQGKTISTGVGPDVRGVFGNNVAFRAASFRPKKGVEFGELVLAAEAYKETFGVEAPEIALGPLVAEIRKAMEREEETLVTVLGLLQTHGLPGVELLESARDQMKAIVRGSDQEAIGAFNASYRTIKDAIRRAAELEQALTGPALATLDSARSTLETRWPFLRTEPDLPAGLHDQATRLADLLARETFFREIPAIDQNARALSDEYARRHQQAVEARVAAYSAALAELTKTPGWTDLPEEARRRISAPLRAGASGDAKHVPIPQLRAETEACASRLVAAIAEVRRLVEGERLVVLRLGGFFGAGVESEEQLEAALEGIREECARHIGAGKKVVVA